MKVTTKFTLENDGTLITDICALMLPFLPESCRRRIENIARSDVCAHAQHDQHRSMGEVYDYLVAYVILLFPSAALRINVATCSADAAYIVSFH